MGEVFEQIEYGKKGEKTVVPVRRANSAEAFIALEPPEGDPYIVAPESMKGTEILEYYKNNVERVEELRPKMAKRYSKGASRRCMFRTGDVAYIMGRPFMVQVNELKGMTGGKKGARGRATVKYEVDTNVSLLTLYVMNENNYDQVRKAFMSYAKQVILKNAAMMAATCAKRIDVQIDNLQVRMRTMNGRFAKLEGSALWLSEDIVPYPVDCLVYTIWRELITHAGIPVDDAHEKLAETLPGWERAAEVLIDREEPYSNQ